VSKSKLSSKNKVEVTLFPRKKLLQEIRKKFPKLFIVGFKAQANVTKKQLKKVCKNFLEENNFQMVVGNTEKAFGADSSEVVIVSSKKTLFVKRKKEIIAGKILDTALAIV